MFSKRLVRPKYSPFCITALFFLVSGSLVDFLQAAFITNVGYVDVENNFFIPQGLLIIRLLILALFISWVLHKKNKLSRPLQFVFIWLAFSLFSAYFSNRPYTHYLLLVLPAFSLAIGMLLTLNKKTARKFAVMLAIVAVFLYQTFWHFTPQKTVEYYTNFLAFIQNKSTVQSYQAFFDSRTPRDYDVASYLKLHLKKGETFFLWGNSAQL